RARVDQESLALRDAEARALLDLVRLENGDGSGIPADATLAAGRASVAATRSLAARSSAAARHAAGFGRSSSLAPRHVVFLLGDALERRQHAARSDRERRPDEDREASGSPRVHSKAPKSSTRFGPTNAPKRGAFRGFASVREAPPSGAVTSKTTPVRASRPPPTKPIVEMVFFDS